MNNPKDARIALAIIGSHTTAIAAELIAQLPRYDRVLAITRRGTATNLPVALEGDEWAKTLKQLGWFGAKKTMKAFGEQIEALTGGQPYDALLHHTTDPFSQLLVEHPLCRRYFYMEEGFTALTGDKFGRPKARPVKRILWRIKSVLFYAGVIDRYRPFFDVDGTRYGGVYALSKDAFKNFPKRTALPFRDISAPLPAPAEIVVFLDSQYLLGNCAFADYKAAVLDTVSKLCGQRPKSVALKFHPRETDLQRKSGLLEAVASLGGVTSVSELPPGFVGERMAFSADVQVVVGTTALGFYLGERGFRTFTFAPRLAASSPRYARLMADVPPEFFAVCQPA